MTTIMQLIEQAKEYARNYAAKYHVVDDDVLGAIFYGHLAYLVNRVVV